MAQPEPLYGDDLLKGLPSVTLVVSIRKLAMLLGPRILKDRLPAQQLHPLKALLQSTGNLQ